MGFLVGRGVVDFDLNSALSRPMTHRIIINFDLTYLRRYVGQGKGSFSFIFKIWTNWSEPLDVGNK